MAIIIKSKEQIKQMHIAGEIVAKTFDVLKPSIKPGISTEELDNIADDFIRSQNAIPSFKDYDGFPKSICISINEEVIHGIPSIRKLKDGDIVSIDIGAYIHGFHGDAARTFEVGQCSDEDKRLIDVTEKSFFECIKYAKEGYHLNDISTAVQKVVEKAGFSVVREYCGHGIGKDLHEKPQVLNYKQKVKGPRLRAGMVLAIEPMVNAGTADIKLLGDGWTVVTMDKKKSSHYENTVVITDGEPELPTYI